MNNTIGSMNWDACRNCRYCPDTGGCNQGVPEDLTFMELMYDSIECRLFTPRE